MDNNSDSNPFRQGLDQLSSYGPGSSRGALLPIDQAVRDALTNAEAGRELESALLGAMDSATTLGCTYLLTQLALIGGTRTAARMGPLLHHPDLADPARRGLEALPMAAASAAVKAELPRLSGLQRVGALHSLGRIGDPASVRTLVRELKGTDPSVQDAALAALGRIGSPRAGRALRAFLGRDRNQYHSAARESALKCAERLETAGHAKQAEALRDLLRKSTAPFPASSGHR